MFCSGNVTERMRAKSRRLSTPLASSQPHVVVDLYAGIGYYTVPLLVSNTTCVVHACEWNEDSVLALRRNLDTNGVKERCRVWHGDNKEAFCNSNALLTSRREITVVTNDDILLVPHLDSIADSVSLGLLPSSRSGWILAARALKREGGQLWLHENVRDTPEDIRALVCEAENFFLVEFAKLDKPLQVACSHVEAVKNYAPKVVHVVLDILCTSNC